MPGNRTTLIHPTVKVTAPNDWTDEQAEAVFEAAEEMLDLGLEAVKVKIQEVHPDLDLYWSI
jgi:hypothetical protein